MVDTEREFGDLISSWRKTGNTGLLLHLLLLNVSSEVLGQESKAREKTKGHEAEERVALEQLMIMLIIMSSCSWLSLS